MLIDSAGGRLAPIALSRASGHEEDLNDTLQTPCFNPEIKRNPWEVGCRNSILFHVVGKRRRQPRFGPDTYKPHHKPDDNYSAEQRHGHSYLERSRPRRRGERVPIQQPYSGCNGSSLHDGRGRIDDRHF
jgi:hypothetical protein